MLIPERRAPRPSVLPPRPSCLGSGVHHRGIRSARKKQLGQVCQGRLLLGALASGRSRALELVLNPWPSRCWLVLAKNAFVKGLLHTQRSPQ